jgi:hypothetical protein
MNIFKKYFLLCLSLVLLQAFPSFGGNDASQFIGRWALHFEEGTGWLEVKQNEGFLDAELLWRSGSVLPVANIFVSDGKLIVTRISEEVFDVKGGEKRTHTITSTLELKGNDDLLIGTMTEPEKDGSGATVFYVYARRIPPLPAAPDLSSVKYGKSIDLLRDGMSGWSLLEPEAVNGWKFEKGVLINNPVQKEGVAHIHYGNLRTNQVFEDFNLTLSVNVPEGSNSGIYLRGIYEIQVVDSKGKDLDSHNMGALYSRITPSEAAEKKAGKWQKMDITLCDRHLTVILNGKKVIDNQPIDGITGGAMASDEFEPGPIYLQGDHGQVSYKDIVLTPIIRD